MSCTFLSHVDQCPDARPEPLRVMILCAGFFETVESRASEASTNLFRHLQNSSEVEAVLVHAKQFASLAEATGLMMRGRNRDEFVASVPAVDPVTLCSRNPVERDLVLTDLIDHIKPDIVHLFDVEGFGVDVVDLLVERRLPTVLTLSGDLGALFERRQSDPKSVFARTKLLNVYLSRIGTVVAPDAFLADRLLATGYVSFLQIVVGPNRIVPEFHIPPMPSSTSSLEAEDGSAGLLKARRTTHPIRLAAVLSENPDADLNFWHEALALLPIAHRRRFTVTFLSEAGSGGPEAAVSRAWEGQAKGLAVGRGSALMVPPSLRHVTDGEGIRRHILSLDGLLVFSVTERLSLEAVAEAISLDVPFLYPGRFEVGSNRALGATLFDPDAAAHLAHCLLMMSKSAKAQRAIEHSAREMTNGEAVRSYIELYQQMLVSLD